jgi:hypothetical protein
MKTSEGRSKASLHRFSFMVTRAIKFTKEALWRTALVRVVPGPVAHSGVEERPCISIDNDFTDRASAHCSCSSCSVEKRGEGGSTEREREREQGGRGAWSGVGGDHYSCSEPVREKPRASQRSQSEEPVRGASQRRSPVPLAAEWTCARRLVSEQAPASQRGLVLEQAGEQLLVLEQAGEQLLVLEQAGEQLLMLEQAGEQLLVLEQAGEQLLVLEQAGEQLLVQHTERVGAGPRLPCSRRGSAEKRVGAGLSYVVGRRRNAMLMRTGSRRRESGARLRLGQWREGGARLRLGRNGTDRA